MLMKWVDIGFASANGFSQGAFLFLGLFIYPIWKLFKMKPINGYGGIGSAAVGVLIAIGYISELGFFFGAGPVFFMLACGALGFGVYKYQEA